MKILDDYLKIEKQVHEYFGYVEDWKAIPIDDCRKYYWSILNDEGHGGSVRYAEDKNDLKDGDGNCYEDDIYTQRFLPKWVYRGEDYTMIACDPHVDGNQFYLRIFYNSKEIK